MLIAPSQTKRGGAELLPLFPRKRALQVGEEVFEDLPCLFRAPSLFLVSAFISGCRDNITKSACSALCGQMLMSGAETGKQCRLLLFSNSFFE